MRNLLNVASLEFSTITNYVCITEWCGGYMKHMQSVQHETFCNAVLTLLLLVEMPIHTVQASSQALFCFQTIR